MVITLTHLDPQVGRVGHGQVARVCYCDGNLVEPTGQETYPQSELGVLTCDDTETDESLSRLLEVVTGNVSNCCNKLTTNVFTFSLCKKLSSTNKEKSFLHLPFTCFQGYDFTRGLNSFSAVLLNDFSQKENKMFISKQCLPQSASALHTFDAECSKQGFTVRCSS